MLTEIKHRHLEFHDTNRAMAAMEVNYPDGTSTDLHSHPRGQLLYAMAGVMIVRSAAGSSWWFRRTGHYGSSPVWSMRSECAAM